MKKNKNKEDKRERAIKIIKIVGSALGLTVCTAGFVALLTIGVRGCAHQSTSNDIQLVKREENKLSYRQLRNEVNPGLESNNDKVYNFVSAADKYPGYFQSNIGNFTASYEISGFVANNYLSGSNGFTPTSYFERFTRIYIERLQSGNTIDVSFHFNNYIVVYRKVGTNKWIYQNDVEALAYDDCYALDGYISLNTSLEDYAEEHDFTSSEQLGYIFLNKLLSEDFRKGYNYGITFNNVINPFAPYGANYDYFLNLSVSGAKTIFRGLFYDNTGELYTGIKMYYLAAQGMRYGTTTDYQTYTGDGSHYLTMSYVKLDGTELTTNAQDYGIATSGNQSGQTVMLKTNRWISNQFQSITILDMYENLEEYPSRNYNRMQELAALNNNNINNASYYDNNNGVLGGVFDLIRGAFSAWLPVFSVQVLPGVALGVFVFLPLIVMIVIAIVWLFKR